MTNLRIRPAVAALPRYVPSMTAPGAVKISSNEMPTPPSPAVLEAIARELETINRYPDLTAAPLREALATRFGVGADQVCVGTGSSAILVAALSAVCQPGTQVIYPWRSFESYPIAVPSVGGDPMPVELLPDGTHDLDAMRAAWDLEPVQTGMGGSIPFIADLKQTFPQAQILVTGVEDPDTRAHSANESLYIPDFKNAILAEALLLSALGTR